MVFNGDLYGTFFSRQKNSSLILANINGIPCPCFIVGFAQCTFVFKQSDTTTISEGYIVVRVFPLQEHPQKLFYPKPAEVWQNPHTNQLQDSSKLKYILTASIVCHCAYSHFYDAQAFTDGITVIPCNPYFGIIMPS